MRLESPEGGRDMGLALAYHAMKRNSESDAALARYTKARANEDAYGIAVAHAYRGELDQALIWLDRAFLQKDESLWGIKSDPRLVNLDADPRYHAFLRKLRLPE
jgi:tetratricopeptide (TPR) repeat protein